MKRILYCLLVVLLVTFLTSCAQGDSASSGEGINPGDKIGNFLITTGVDEEVIYSWDRQQLFEKQGDEEVYSLKLPVGTKMNVSAGVYAASDGSGLDEKWDGHTYKMFIDGRPVNLEAFGPIDTKHPIVGAMRAWNVVITTTEPGEITVRSEGTVDGEPFGDTTTYIFTTP